MKSKEEFVRLGRLDIVFTFHDREIQTSVTRYVQMSYPLVDKLLNGDETAANAFSQAVSVLIGEAYNNYRKKAREEE